MSLHLRPSAPIAPDALLPGDPGRALALAQALLVEPRMSNHNRGLWGYWGETPEGRPLTIQSTGMGGPSAAIVLTELAELGVSRAIRVGTCGALDPGLSLGALVRAEAALAEDGASRGIGAADRVRPDPALLAALAAQGGSTAATVCTTDLFYDPSGRDQARRGAWAERGAAAVEMETATLLALGEALGVATASLLAVSDVFGPEGRERIGGEALDEAGERMGRIAAAALLSPR